MKGISTSGGRAIISTPNAVPTVKKKMAMAKRLIIDE
jgi:hypothetical protein